MSKRWSFLEFLGRVLLFVTGAGIVLFSLVGALFRGVQEGVPAGIWFGLNWGVASSLGLGIVNYFGVRKIVRRYGCTPDYNPRQTRTTTVKRSLEGVMPRIQEGIRGLPGVKEESVTRTGEMICAVTAPTWRSAGEDITVSAKTEGPETTILEVESKPRTWGMIMDYGKGLENVEEITRAIHSWLDSSAQ